MDTTFSPGRLRHLLALAGALIVACLAPFAARADDDLPGRVGRVAEVVGEARTINPEGAWVTLVRNQPLSTGDRITTDKSARATLQVGSTTLRVGAASDVVVTQLDDRKFRIRFDHGQLALRVRSDDILGELFIETDEGAWVPHHPGQYRFDRVARGVLGAQAVVGDMLLEAPDSSLPVAANQRAEVWRAGAQQATHYRMTAPAKDAFGDWALAQDKADDKLAAASAAAGVPIEMTGAADLARHGVWSTGADGARVWTPAKLPAGWQPFQQGAWSWISPWGWTWVDDQPWGFAPFHYGRWFNQRGHWNWTPGQWGATRPIYAPGLVGWFGGAGLAVAGAPAVGWVALAPDEAFHPAYAVSSAYWAAINNPSVAAPARRALPAAKARVRVVPTGAMRYANRGAADAIAVLASAGLVSHAPVSTMPTLAKAERRKALADEALARLAVQGPPGPPVGHSALSPTASVVQVPVGLATANTPARAPSPAGKSVGAAAPPIANIARPSAGIVSPAPVLKPIAPV
ncbi:MAG: DUF6600 domain-containing protein, partial [Betaproteobacteria bacterium]